MQVANIFLYNITSKFPSVILQVLTSNELSFTSSTHWYKIADGEYSTEQLKCLKVSALQIEGLLTNWHKIADGEYSTEQLKCLKVSTQLNN